MSARQEQPQISLANSITCVRGFLEPGGFAVGFVRVPNFTEEARIIRELTRTGRGPDPFSSAVRATRMPMLITDPRQPDNPIVFANAAFARLTGYDRQDILGRNCRFLQGPATDTDDIARLRAAVDQRTTIELELLNYRADGSTFWNRLLVSPVFDDDGQLTYFFASQMDVTVERERLARLERDRDALEAEVGRRNADLYRAELRLRDALQAGRLGTWTIDLDTNRLIASAECKAICGRSPSDPLSLEELRATIHPADRALHEEAIADAVADRTPFDVEYRLTLPEGVERWVQVRGQAAYRADGTAISIAGTTQDVTDRRRLEEQRALLADELSHRVKNALASLQSVASLTLRQAQSLEDAETKLSSRITAMAAAHDLLITEDFASASLDRLLHRTLAPFGAAESNRLTLAGPEVALPSSLVAALALAFHELATNAAKYGALSRDEGQVRIAWEVEDVSPPMLDLTWTESGGPAVTPPTAHGFGTRMIERTLSAEVGASAQIDYRPDGVVFRYRKPLHNPAK